MDLVVVPVQIRPDVVAQFKVPPDLTKEEAEKIARVIIAWAVPNGNQGDAA